MPPIAAEPGTRLVDRYRLEAPIGELGGVSYWRALDELLDRLVGVCLLDAEAARSRSILGAARRAAAVTDPRFLRVLDASETDGVVYVVTEWVRARSLTDLLADGPLPAAEARDMVADVAEALAAAHADGLAHLCLQPEHILRTAHGQLKVAGLAVDAAVRGVRADGSEDAARSDARGCGALLYAALTARWPGDEQVGLVPAPYDAGDLCSPRQVRAGVPDDLDQIAVRALGTRIDSRGRAGGPLATPSQVAAALASAHVTARMPVVAPAAATDTGQGAPPFAAPYDDIGRPRRSSPATRAAWVLTALVLVIGLGLAGWQLIVAALDASEQPASGPTQSAGSSATPGGSRALRVASVQAFDPAPDGNGEENDENVALVVDGDTGTEWTTMTYFDPFGPTGIKDGVGLVLDLGRRQNVSRAIVDLQGAGTDLELRVGNSPGQSADDFRTVATATDQSGRAELRPDSPVNARYLLVWLTGLPSTDGSDYRGAISEIDVRGPR